MASVGTANHYQVLSIDPYSAQVSNKEEVSSYIHQRMSTAKINPSSGVSECRDLKFEVKRGDRTIRARFTAFINKDGAIQVKFRRFKCLPNFLTWKTKESRIIEEFFNTPQNAAVLKESVNKNNEPRPEDFRCHLNLDLMGSLDELVFYDPHEDKCRTLTIRFSKQRGTQPLLLESESSLSKPKYKWGVYDETEVKLKLNTPVRLDCRQSTTNAEAAKSDPVPVRIAPVDLLTKAEATLKFTFEHNEDKSITLTVSEVPV